MDSGFLDDMEKRGLVAQVVKPDELRALANKEVITAYAGFDPTADSLHVGHLVPAIALARLQRSGHRPIAIVGGGTGLIGDPSGKAKERQLLTKEQVEANCAGIKAQLQKFLDFSPGPSGAQLVNNGDWLCTTNLVDFLRDVGKHFAVNEMIKRDSVKVRFESEQGISFTEFSYMLLQSFDFLVLFDKFGCKFQIGGSDQFGNIVSGIELIRRTRSVETFGLTVPLVTKADGTKFGKTESGSVWLDSKRTSPFKLFQFWLRTDDRDVAKLLRWFTFVPVAEIDELEKETLAHPEQRAGHNRLAREMTRFIHGDHALAQAEKATAVLFGKGELRELSAEQLLDIFDEVPAKQVPRAKLEGEGARLLDLVLKTEAEPGLCASMREAKNDLSKGALYVNGAKATGEARVTTKDLIDGKVVVLRKGKANNLVVKVV